MMQQHASLCDGQGEHDLSQHIGTPGKLSQFEPGEVDHLQQDCNMLHPEAAFAQQVTPGVDVARSLAEMEV